MFSATVLLIILVTKASAFATTPSACVGSSSADVQAAVHDIFSRMAEAEVEDDSCPWDVPGFPRGPPNASLCLSFAPKTCAEVLEKGVCENADAAGLKCCECGDSTELDNPESQLLGPVRVGQEARYGVLHGVPCRAGYRHGNICSAQEHQACTSSSSRGCCSTCWRPCDEDVPSNTYFLSGGCYYPYGTLFEKADATLRCRSVGRRRRRRGRSNTCQEGCHPAASTVELEGGGTLPMDELAVGHRIRVPDGHAPVLGFLHQEHSMTGEYFVLTAGKRALAVSSHHYIVANGKEVDPSTVKIGDVLHTPEGNATVTRVQQKLAAGAFHPFVAGGELYVDGLLATDYNDHTPKWAWELMRAYVATRYHLGIPVIPEGHGLVKRPFFAFDALDKMGVPSTAQWPLIPLLIPTVLAAELVNLAAESSLFLAAATLAALMYLSSRKVGKKAKRA